MTDKQGICCWCNKPILSKEFNAFLGKNSHKDCDDKYFEKQEKMISYGRKSNEYV